MTVLYDWSVRAAAYRGLLAGRSASTVAAGVGVSRQGVIKWAKLVGMDVLPGRVGGVVVLASASVSVPSGRASYRRLTLADRVFIEQALAGPAGWSQSRIAEHLRVSRSTISRELKRHGVEHGLERRAASKPRYYLAELAHHQAMRARHAADPKKLDDPVLRAVVLAGLNNGWSPDSVAGRLRRLFPDRPELHVSHETIYQALYVQGRGALRHELTVEQALRSGRTTRKPQSKLPTRSKRPWLEGARLSDRPAEAEDRAVPGHWEGDLVVGPHNSGIITLVERRSRFVLLGRLPGRRDSDTVLERMQEMVQTLPEAMFDTITWDQGAEMAHHADFTIAEDCALFFCDPHSPWQRGSNENTNGLLRHIYPKGTDFSTVTDAELTATQDMLNARPRKTLQYATPSEKLREEINVALAS